MMAFFWGFYLALAQPWPIISPPGATHTYPQSIEPQNWLHEANSGWAKIPSGNIEHLKQQCLYTYNYIKKHPQQSIGVFSSLGFHKNDVQKTLQHIIKTIDTNPQKLEEVAWWESNFRLFWLNDLSKAAPEKIRLTKYVVYQLQGSEKKTPQYNHALWEIPSDAIFRTRYTRQDILGGVLEKEPSAKPLVWIRKADVFEAQMQGSIEIQFPNGSKKLFNVHVSNEFPYQKGVHSEKQKRYWFFREVDHVYGWGEEEKVPITPMVSFAGDIDNFGLGQVLWIDSSQGVSLGVLADTGGAFQPNLGQFDWFIGFAQNKHHFLRIARTLPPYAKVGFLLPR